MTTLNCHIPLTLRVRGEPTAADWAALEDALTTRYATALRRGMVELSRQERDGTNPAAAPFAPDDERPQGYQISSFEDGGLTTIPLRTAPQASLGASGAQPSPAGFDPVAIARRLQDAIEGPGTDEDAILAALSGHTAAQVTAISAAYRQLTGHELRADLEDDLSDDELQQALSAMGTAPTVYEQNTELGGLSVGNFDFHFRNCSALIWVWLKFRFSDDITSAERTAFKKRFLKAIDATWGNPGFSLRGGSSCPCPVIPIRIHAEESIDDFYHKLVDVERESDEERRPMVVSDINVNFATSDLTLAHEFGHVLGLYDEYDGPWIENIMFWHRNRPDDPEALMNDGTKLRRRYFEHIRRRVQQTAQPGCMYWIAAPGVPGP